MSLKNQLKQFVGKITKNRSTMIWGYIRKKKIYKSYDENTVFICGIPEHGNRGDQAISKAEVTFVSKCMPESKIVLIPESELLENIYCLKRHTDRYNSVVLGHGGGNIGELYPFQEYIRLSMVKKLKNAKIVIFPQSIDYNGKSEALEKAQKIYNSHKNLFIFTREAYSEELRKKFFPNCKGGLVPDIVLSYKPQTEDFEREGILFCTRHDKEKNQQSEKLLTALENAAKNCDRKIAYTDTTDYSFACKYSEQINGLNKIWTEFKKSEIVITDRLHGMIFCVITNTPCIAVDNSTGKVGNLYKTWLEKSGVIYVAEENGLKKAVEAIENKSYIKPSVDAAYINTSFSPLSKGITGK